MEPQAGSRARGEGGSGGGAEESGGQRKQEGGEEEEGASSQVSPQSQMAERREKARET